MTSPVGATDANLPQAIDLTLHDVAETDLVAAMIGYFQTKFPGWQQIDGSVEVVMMESAALLTRQQLYALNQLPQVVFDAVIQLLGVRRLQPVAATARLLITMSTSVTGVQTVPAGTQFRIDTDTAVSIDAVATTAVTSAPGDTVIDVPIAAVDPGQAPNGVGAGTTVQLITPLSWVEAIAFRAGYGFVGGVDAETDAAFYPRAAAFLRRRTDTLVRPSDFQTAALEVDGIGRSLAVDRWDAVSLVSPHVPGTVNGHITVVVARPAGAAATSQVKANVLAYLQAGALASLTVHVIDPVYYAPQITATIAIADGYDSAAVLAAAQTALAAYMSPATAPFGRKVLSQKLIGMLSKIDGVDYVISVTGSTVDQNRGAWDLPNTAGTLSVVAG